MSKDILRTFFGFSLPREVSRTASGLRTLVEDPKNAVRWVKGENIHLTVRFLGATPKTVLEQIGPAITEKLKNCTPMMVHIDRTGVFPVPSRPRILWMGVEGDISPLQEIERNIHEVVGPLGFPKEQRPFVPHVTIGRVRYPQKITPDVSKFINAEFDQIECPLNELHLFESRPADKGVVYIPVLTFPLKALTEEGS
ncbi:RNA 2',3'-cyclic phosphodiesterase [Candidatus Neomarinimicrobiota bacterium]